MLTLVLKTVKNTITRHHHRDIVEDYSLVRPRPSAHAQSARWAGNFLLVLLDLVLAPGARCKTPGGRGPSGRAQLARGWTRLARDRNWASRLMVIWSLVKPLKLGN